MAEANIGEIAPDFTLAATGGEKFTLSAQRTRRVVLVFYPGDATPVCTEQLKSYTKAFPDFSALDAVVVGISPQDIDSHEAFHAEHAFAFPLLFDEDKRVGRQYGVVGPLGFYRRSLAIIDRAGVLCHLKRSTAGLSYPSSEDIVAMLRDID